MDDSMFFPLNLRSMNKTLQATFLDQNNLVFDLIRSSTSNVVSCTICNVFEFSSQQENYFCPYLYSCTRAITMCKKSSLPRIHNRFLCPDLVMNDNDLYLKKKSGLAELVQSYAIMAISPLSLLSRPWSLLIFLSYSWTPHQKSWTQPTTPSDALWPNIRLIFVYSRILRGNEIQLDVHFPLSIIVLTFQVLLSWSHVLKCEYMSFFCV